MSDAKLQALRRRVAQGDNNAVKELGQELIRTGRPTDVEGIVGYETRVYICHKYSWMPVEKWPVDKDGMNRQFLSTIAMIDLSKAGHNAVGQLVAKGIERSKKEKLRPYLKFAVDNDGDEGDPIDTDPYGDPLALHDAGEFLAALKTDQAADSYRRFEMAIALLEVTIKRFEGEGVIIVTEGH